MLIMCCCKLGLMALVLRRPAAYWANRQAVGACPLAGRAPALQRCTAAAPGACTQRPGLVLGAMQGVGHPQHPHPVSPVPPRAVYRGESCWSCCACCACCACCTCCACCSRLLPGHFRHAHSVSDRREAAACRRAGRHIPPAGAACARARLLWLAGGRRPHPGRWGGAALAVALKARPLRQGTCKRSCLAWSHSSSPAESPNFTRDAPASSALLASLPPLACPAEPPRPALAPRCRHAAAGRGGGRPGAADAARPDAAHASCHGAPHSQRGGLLLPAGGRHGRRPTACSTMPEGGRPCICSWLPCAQTGAVRRARHASLAALPLPGCSCWCTLWRNGVRRWWRGCWNIQPCPSCC